jgi:hypothetical protein
LSDEVGVEISDEDFDNFIQPQFPDTIGEVADLLYETKAQLTRANKVVEALRSRILELDKHIIDTLPMSNLTGAMGGKAKVRVISKEKPVVRDWPAFYAYVKQNDAFELLQKRLGEAAYNERLEHGEQVPGVEMFQLKEVSCTKL